MSGNYIKLLCKQVTENYISLLCKQVLGWEVQVVTYVSIYTSLWWGTVSRGAAALIWGLKQTALGELQTEIQNGGGQCFNSEREKYRF